MEIKPMIESIVRELLEAWRKDTVQPPKVLFVFCDSTAHEAYSDHFIHLQNHGVCHDILFLDGETSAWLGMNKLECGGAGRVLTADEYAPAPIEVPRDYEGIIIPEIDLDSAARVALGMKGTIKSEIIFSAIVQGKFVLVGEDSSGLKRADRRTLKTLTLPKPYNNLFAYYKHELQMLGIEFGPQKRLAELAVGKCGKESTRTGASKTPETPETQETPAKTQETGNEPKKFEGKLVTAGWVQTQVNAANISKLVIKRTTIVSPLAKDVLKDHKIVIQYSDEG
ncbi:hypothetical protein [Cohnella luojiensis]|uniref:Ethanolamine utilization protein n=1 Tax=Cohnella luojiensis TaxID=652876 RepID=A0A4Y8LQB3_9BACL|nr:hypothetical protein [Cohnella luojiensis]TFE23552.1 hypothetical protein E2980_18860 [Cohnella luojiensis]